MRQVVGLDVARTAQLRQRQLCDLAVLTFDAQTYACKSELAM